MKDYFHVGGNGLWEIFRWGNSSQKWGEMDASPGNGTRLIQVAARN